MGKDEKERHVRTLGTGEFFGEIALLEEKPRTASIVVKEDVEFYSLDKHKFLEASKKSESFHKKLLDTFFRRGYH